jgi:hypothetical protein
MGVGCLSEVLVDEVFHSMGEPTNNRRVDEALRAVIVIAAMLIGYFLGRASAVPAETAARPLNHSSVPAARSIGERIALPGIDWSRSERTLILALQTTCHFCRESGSFYKRLVAGRARFGDTRLVAILPEDVSESKEYLSNLGVSVDAVLQGSLTRIGVAGTPTLLLVHNTGVVTEAWSGKLGRAAEGNVFSRLQAK